MTEILFSTTLAIDAIVAGPTTPYNTKNNNEIKDSCLAGMKYICNVLNLLF